MSISGTAAKEYKGNDDAERSCGGRYRGAQTRFSRDAGAQAAEEWRKSTRRKSAVGAHLRKPRIDGAVIALRLGCRFCRDGADSIRSDEVFSHAMTLLALWSLFLKFQQTSRVLSHKNLLRLRRRLKRGLPGRPGRAESELEICAFRSRPCGRGRFAREFLESKSTAAGESPATTRNVTLSTSPHLEERIAWPRKPKSATR